MQIITITFELPQKVVSFALTHFLSFAARKKESTGVKREGIITLR